jgi:excisionase family DNA binding protein
MIGSKPKPPPPRPPRPPPPPPVREAYSVREVAERFGLHRDTIYQEINEGRLEARKVRGRTVVLRDALDAWCASLPCMKHGQSLGYRRKVLNFPNKSK